MGPKKRPKTERPKLSSWSWSTPSKQRDTASPGSDDEIQVLEAWPPPSAQASSSKRPRTESASPASNSKPDLWEEDNTEGMGMDTDEEVVELETMGGFDACPICGESLRSMSREVSYGILVRADIRLPSNTSTPASTHHSPNQSHKNAPPAPYPPCPTGSPSPPARRLPPRRRTANPTRSRC